MRPQAAFFGSPPDRVSVRSFRGPRDTLATMARIAHGPTGERSHLVRRFTEAIVREVQPKDYLGEILAVRNVFVQPSPKLPGVPMFRYTNDPRHVEWIKHPQRLIEEVLEHGTSLCDCEESSCLKATMLLQLGRDVQFIALGFARDSLTHVGVRVKEPKSGRWIWLDSVAGPREREAARRAVEVLPWSLD